MKRTIFQVLEFLIFFTPTIMLSAIFSNKFDDKIVFLKNYPFLSIVIATAISGILYYFRNQFKKYDENEEIEKLQKEKQDIEREIKFYQGLITDFKQQISKELEDELYKAFKKLELKNQHRITIYTYTYGTFFSIARYSSNFSLNKFGRIAIKDKSEQLFKVWNDGKEVIIKIEPNQSRNMKTRKIGIFFLYEKNNKQPKKDKFGVIVFESTNKNDKILIDKNIKLFKEVVDNINEYFYKSWSICQCLDIAIKEQL